MLYLIATPIGNLKDITYRAVETMKICDYILCEDTRISSILLKHYEIKTPLKSYHKYSERKQLEKIISDLKNGMTIGLISDAGTPGVSDPGKILISMIDQEKLPYTSLPGPSASINAYLLCPFQKERFQFIGFLPKKKNEKNRALLKAVHFNGLTIAYESPQRINETLKMIQHNPNICICREMTKKFEEILVGKSQDLLKKISDKPIKGEIVLIIEGDSFQGSDDVTIEDLIMQLQEEGFPLKEAIAIAAKIKKEPKKNIYKKVHLQ
ncbi:MAG TPA: 16S rRNA (cytidine(1402)-2'-O)-methyltransferase [Chlamydiales bacterium]|nr:16S rRNA (cytidine(1402)-2'-O)-methyltransferase [Chlamydiales bacterium]